MDKLKLVLKWLHKKVTYQNNNWYVFLALIASVIQIWTFVKVSDTQTDIKNIQTDILYNNQNGIVTKGLSGEEFFQMYFGFLAKEDYMNACGLESKRRCDKSDSEKLTQYGVDKNRVWFTKWNDGEHLEKVWSPTIQPDAKNLESWCVETKYTLKGENIPVTQVMRYDILTRSTGEKQIASALCEKTIKNGQDRTKQMGCGQSNICNK